MELIKYCGYFDFGRQMSLPKNESAIPISPQIFLAILASTIFLDLIPS